jgi:DNA-binding CsgD family transcriptional regulator
VIGPQLKPGNPELTKREKQVERLLCQGLEYKQIGHRLGIAPRTVSAHTSHLFAKRNVHGHVELIYAWLHRNGIYPERIDPLETQI